MTVPHAKLMGTTVSEFDFLFDSAVQNRIGFSFLWIGMPQFPWEGCVLYHCTDKVV